jgi:nitroreductase
MDLFEAVEARRSIRKFLPEPVPTEVIERALDAALLAPNSSNLQTWDFYWVRSAPKKARLVHLCLDQSAARTAAELVVVTADPGQWRRSNPELVRFVREIDAPKAVKLYYERLVPLMYGEGPVGAVARRVATTAAGLFRPIMRGPSNERERQEVAIKSAALASENFVLALTAQGYASCMMEGFDEPRVRELLELPSTTRVVMVIAAGREGPRGTWGPRFRLDRERVVHRV